MKQRRRIYFSPEQRDEIWDRWKAGESLHAIGRTFDRGHSSIFAVLARTGGVRPPPRTRSERALSLTEREEISRGLSAGLSLRAIARGLERPASTVAREVTRNGGRGRYRAARAETAAWDRARRPKPAKLAQLPALARAVSEKLALQWSPWQIAGWLKRAYWHDETLRVSHETIYKSLFIQARGALKKDLVKHLRSRRAIRRSRTSSLKGAGLGRIKDAISIRERPAAAEDRAVPGHWEGDLIAGSNNTCIATLVERHSRYVMLVKVTSKDTASVVAALIKHARTLPRELSKSLTWDRGKELAAHARFTLATDMAVYFCDPQSPWQRGSNENTNGLLRQYFPKGTDLSEHSQAHLDAIARRLNERPRKTLDFDTPAARFEACVASTA